MLVSLKWLKELVDVDVPVPELVDKLDMTGTAVEAVHELGEALEGVVVGAIVAKDRHPDADKLWVTTVDVGSDEPLTIVCGAQNFEAGDRVPVALVGTTLPNGMKIKQAKLRGVVSSGMNCSAAELGLGEDASGILVLPQDAPVGTAFAEYRGLGDTVLELEVTPNRPDCLSVAGVAREVGAVFGVPSTIPASSPSEGGALAAEAARVTIDDPDLCPRYSARLIRGVSIGPSPEWLVERVTASGARSVSNVVDVTNYVMFELGQPLHAFDARTIARDADGRMHVIVRRAREGERLTTLDGVDRVLDQDILTIADESGVIALAGVMGGESTEVSEATVDILLESACFDPATTSRTSRSLGLISEASMRFERGVDREGCVRALDRAADLIAQVGGGEVAPGVIDQYPAPARPSQLPLRVGRMCRFVGAEIGSEESAAILSRLGCEVTDGPDPLSVVVPSYRPDLQREVDLVEEVLRVWGMERVEPTLPASPARVGGRTRVQRTRDLIGQTVRGAGLNETMTWAFADDGDLDRLGGELDEDERLVRILNPMSAEQESMRRTLLPGLLRAVSFNQRRQVEDVQLYELGAVFRFIGDDKEPVQEERVAGVLAGRWHPPTWNDPAAPLDFFDGKGVVEELLRVLGISGATFEAGEIPWLQPGRSAIITAGEAELGWLGEVHPRIVEEFDADGTVTAFELDADALGELARDVRDVVEIPRYPAVELDIALVVPESVTARQMETAIAAAAGSMLESARLFVVYRGSGVPEGKKSMAYALTYRAVDRTLSADEIEGTHDRLVRKLGTAVGAELRS